MEFYIKKDKPKTNNAVLVSENKGVFKYRLRDRYFFVDTNKAFQHASNMLKNGF